MEWNNSTKPAVNSEPPSQSIRLSACAKAIGRAFTSIRVPRSGIVVNPARNQNAARHLAIADCLSVYEAT